MKRAILMLAMLPLLLNAFGQNNKKPNVKSDDNEEISLIKCHSKNLLQIMINAAGQLWVKTNDRSGEIKEIRANAKEIIKSAPKEHIIAVMTDEEHGAPQNISDKVKQELKEAYQELRDELARKKYGKDFKSLKKEEKEVIREYYPCRILYMTRDMHFDVISPKLSQPDTIKIRDIYINDETEDESANNAVYEIKEKSPRKQIVMPDKQQRIQKNQNRKTLSS